MFNWDLSQATMRTGAKGKTLLLGLPCQFGMLPPRIVQRSLRSPRHRLLFADEQSPQVCSADHQGIGKPEGPGLFLLHE